MKDYKGIVVIECGEGICPTHVQGADVEPDCINCEYSTVNIIDLDGNILATLIDEEK